MTGAGRPRVYLVHGFLESAAGHYAEQIRALREQYEFVPLDLPGHGRCPVDAEGSFYRGAEHYLDVALRRFGPGHLAAASYVGSPVAVRVALRRPELVRSLVLQGFVPGLDRDTFTGWMNGFEHLALLADEHPQLEAGYTRVHGRRWRHTVAAVLADVERYDERMRISEQQIGALPMPVLLINGSVRTVERECAQRADRFGPRVRGAVVADAGHLPGRQRPAEFNHLVSEFWRSIDAQPTG